MKFRILVAEFIKRISLSIALLLFAWLAVKPVASAAPRARRAEAEQASEANVNPYAGQEQAKEAGAKLFRHNCASCHGKQAQGTRRAPALAPIAHALSERELFQILRNGVLRSGMPSFSGLPPQQRWQLVTYLKNLD